MRSLVELAQARAERYRDKVAFSFSYNGDDDDVSRLTYRELDAMARAIASSLQQQGASGKRVLVLCRPGLDHVAALFGCFYAGAMWVERSGSFRRCHCRTSGLPHSSYPVWLSSASQVYRKML